MEPKHQSERGRTQHIPGRMTISQNQGSVDITLSDAGCGDAECLAGLIINSWADPEYSSNRIIINQVTLHTAALPDELGHQLRVALQRLLNRPVGVAA